MTFPTSITAVDGSRGVRVDAFEVKGHIFDIDALGLAYRMQLAPGARASRVVVVMDRLIEHNLSAWGFKSPVGIDAEQGAIQIGLAAVARHLATLPPGGEEGLRQIPCGGDCLNGLAKVPRSSDDQVLHYLKAKIYWAWKYDLHDITLDWFDTILLGVPSETIDRVSLVAEGEFLKRRVAMKGVITYEPLRLLLKEFPLLLPGAAPTPQAADLLQRLAVPRYAGPSLHMQKALRFMTAEEEDPANAAKEAISAVEGLARIIAHDEQATLGQLIDRFKAEGRLNPALARALAAVWGFASNSPGVRHGATGASPSITPEEAEFVIGASRGAIGLLLALDLP